jgi:glycine hydroxymethyltransferase
MMRKALAAVDPEIAQAIAEEEARQETGLELIASENFTSRAVLEAMGSVLTNKYAEGYPGKRYYGGCEVIDRVEALAIERARALFGAEHVNVQPHSGTSANLAVYFALLKPGDRLLGMDLSSGGHLTHGHRLSYSGRDFEVISYGVDRETEQIDYDALEALAVEKRPRLIIAGASAYSRILDFARFRQIADRVGAYLMADMAHIAGLVAAGLHPSPVPHCDVVTTTTHKTLRGPRGGLILCKKELAREIDRAVFPGVQGGPLEHVIAAKAVALLEASRPEFRRYQERVVENARTLAQAIAERGLRIVSGGTDNHLMLVDVSVWGLTGKVAEQALDRAGMTTNKNTIPFDPQPPLVASGLRLGTPAVTTRGMGPSEMETIADWISQVLKSPEDAALAQAIRQEVRELTARFPLYSSLEPCP